MEIKITIEIKDDREAVGLYKTYTTPLIEPLPLKGCHTGDPLDTFAPNVCNYVTYTRTWNEGEAGEWHVGAPLDFNPNEWPWGC